MLPWALSRGNWHAWASQMPAALAAAGDVLGDASFTEVAARDSGTFDPWLLTSGGPDNGRLPTRTDTTQIAYGVDSRLQSLLATADVTGRTGPATAGRDRRCLVLRRQRVGPACLRPGQRTHRRRHQRQTGGPNLNCGAESTIHGLLSMLALDAHPAVAQAAQQVARIEDRLGTRTLQVEDAALTGDAHPVVPPSMWTGESLFGGTGYAALGDGGSATVAIGRGGPRLVLPVVDLQPGSSAVTTFRVDDTVLGSVASGDIGEIGDSPAPGALLPVTLSVGDGAVHATTSASGGDVARLDALMVEPLVSRLVLSGGDHGTVLLRSAATSTSQVSVAVPGGGAVTIEQYDGSGRLVAESTTGASQKVTVAVLAGGFSVARR